MIVRIMGEGQFVLSDDVIERLSALDDEMEACFERNDEPEFERVRDAMLELVRSSGAAVPDAEIANSDVVLPPSDATIDEVRSMLGAEGLVPG